MKRSVFALSCVAMALLLTAWLTSRARAQDDNGQGDDCGTAVTAEDDDIRAGVPLSFTDNDDGTITDNNTGLVWEKLSQDQSIHGEGAGVTWDDAFSVHVATLNGTSFARHSDWRLPNLRELQGIVNYQNYEPALSSPAFNNNCRPLCTVLTCSCTLKGTYWSSTSVADSPVCAWSALHAVGHSNPVGKSVPNGIRAVRGGA